MNHQKSEYLDGIRGWAAFSVVLYHLSFRIFDRFATSSPFFDFLLRMTIWPGTFAVTIFFVLSGRVLAASFLKAKANGNANALERLASSCFRRPSRMIIPVMVTLLLHWLFQLCNFYEPSWEILKSYGRNDKTWWDFKPNYSAISFVDILTRAVALFLPPFRIPPFPTFSVYWTLPVEFVNSYILYIVVLITSFMKRSKYVFYGLVIAIGLLNYLNGWYAAFISGLLLAELNQDGYFKRVENTKQGWILKITLTMIGLIVFVGDFVGLGIIAGKFMEGLSKIAITDNGRDPAYFELNVNYVIAAWCLIAIVEVSPLLRRLFGSPPFVFLGKVSFGVYLLHPIIIPSFGTWLATIVYNPNGGIDKTLADWIVFVSVILVTMLLSWGFYFIADKPSISFGRYLEGFFFHKDFSMDELRDRYKESKFKETIKNLTKRFRRNQIHPVTEP